VSSVGDNYTLGHHDEVEYSYKAGKGLSEAVVLAKRCGVDPELLLKVIEGSTFPSPWYRSKGGTMLKGDFSPHFALKLMRKDFELMKQVAQELALRLPVTEVVRQLFAEAEATGKGDLDYSVIFEHLQT